MTAASLTYQIPPSSLGAAVDRLIAAGSPPIMATLAPDGAPVYLVTVAEGDERTAAQALTGITTEEQPNAAAWLAVVALVALLAACIFMAAYAGGIV